MKHVGIKIALFLNYFVFAFLLNSVGTVILQVQRSMEISKASASILEGFKDIPIAIASFYTRLIFTKNWLEKIHVIGSRTRSYLLFYYAVYKSILVFQIFISDDRDFIRPHQS